MLAAGSQGKTRGEVLEHALGLNYEQYVSKRGKFNYKKLVDSYTKFTNMIVGERGDSDDPSYKCKVFNGLYHQKNSDDLEETEGVWQDLGKRSIKPQFAQVLKQGYIRNLGEIKALDFQNNIDEAREYINSIVEENTEGKIKNLLATLDDSTLAVLLSVIYFEAKWKRPSGFGKTAMFEEVTENDVNENGNLAFEGLEGELLPVDGKKVRWLQTTSGMIKDFARLHKHEYGDEEVINVVRIPLESSSRRVNVFFNIFHPEFPEQMKDMANWEWERFREILTTAEFEESDDLGTLYLPALSLNFAKNINSWMNDLGMRKVFIQGEADLSPMLPHMKDTAFVRYLRHQATFDLDEDGIVATAATAAIIADKSGESRDMADYYVNSPFYFTVTVKDGTGESIPLFMGKVFDPRTPFE